MGLETILKVTKNFGKDLIKYGTLYAFGTPNEIIKQEKNMPKYIKSIAGIVVPVSQVVGGIWFAFPDADTIAKYADKVTHAPLSEVGLALASFVIAMDGCYRVYNKMKYEHDGFGSGLIGKLKEYTKGDFRKDFCLDETK